MSANIGHVPCCPETTKKCKDYNARSKGYMRWWWRGNSWCELCELNVPLVRVYLANMSPANILSIKDKKKTPQTFYKLEEYFFFVSITFLIQYPSKWAEKCFMETRLLWLPSPKPCCGASNRTIHPFLAMSQWDSWGTPCTISCVFWWSLERTS